MPYTGADSALIIELEGITTASTQFCIGDQLTFRCTLREGSYDWIFPPILDGTVGNGRITLGSTETVGEFSLSTSGADATRMSTLQVTVFE